MTAKTLQPPWAASPVRFGEAATSTNSSGPRPPRAPIFLLSSGDQPGFPTYTAHCCLSLDMQAGKYRGGGDTARTNSENILRISRARPGRRPVRVDTRWWGRADVAWDWNLTDLVGLGPVILKISPAGPGAGWARRRRIGPARPHLRELALPKKPLDLKYWIF